ncbi:MAG: hypothetical protein H6767_07390 [Candidatus Peribacteria bacterium]|nr:MAG: hypothetical protein H6767_07390 [Candidatus Peribacteria bacterium]
MEYESGSSSGFYMRELSRDLDEQINSIKRELDNLYDLGILRYKMELKKKIFFLNDRFPLIEEFTQIFLKSYDPIDKIKAFFKTITGLELVIVNESLKNKLFEPGKSILDIFLIGEIDKDAFNSFLSQTFYGRKIKYAIITTEDFYHRLEFGDKLIKNILTESGNMYLRDNLKIKEKLDL